MTQTTSNCSIFLTSVKLNELKIIRGFQPLTIITKSSTLDVAAVLDPPLIMKVENWKLNFNVNSVLIKETQT